MEQNDELSRTSIVEYKIYPLYPWSHIIFTSVNFL